MGVGPGQNLNQDLALQRSFEILLDLSLQGCRAPSATAAIISHLPLLYRFTAFSKRDLTQDPIARVTSLQLVGEFLHVALLQRLLAHAGRELSGELRKWDGAMVSTLQRLYSRNLAE